MKQMQPYIRMPKGGRFAALEVPGAYVQYLRDASRLLDKPM